MLIHARRDRVVEACGTLRFCGPWGRARSRDRSPERTPPSRCTIYLAPRGPGQPFEIRTTRWPSCARPGKSSAGTQASCLRSTTRCDACDSLRVDKTRCACVSRRLVNMALRERGSTSGRGGRLGGETSRGAAAASCRWPSSFSSVRALPRAALAFWARVSAGPPHMRSITRSVASWTSATWRPKRGPHSSGAAQGGQAQPDWSRRRPRGHTPQLAVRH